MAEEQAIIIKKIKKGGHGHHGGAWKVAYADFVTAMMAFFLLLWLLSSTTKEQKEGIAEYFTPTIGLKDAKGIGFEGGEKPQAEGKSRTDTTTMAPVPGSTPQGEEVTIPENKAVQAPVEAETVPTAPPEESKDEAAKQEESAPMDEETQRFMQTEEEIKKGLEQDPDLNELKNNVLVTHTAEGLRIDVIDDTTHPMFAPGSATLTGAGRALMGKLGEVVAKSQNQISITGHTDATPYPPGAKYTNWELSGDRALASRRFLASTTLPAERVAKVVAMADRDLLDPKEPSSPRNRRISFVLLRGTQAEESKNPGLKTLLNVPDVDKEGIEREAKTKRTMDQEKVLREKLPSIFDDPSAGGPMNPPPVGHEEQGGAKPSGKALLSVPAVDLKQIEQEKARIDMEKKKKEDAAAPSAPVQEKKAPSVFDQPPP